MTRLRLGMVGGGEGAFIGAVHRMAAALDGDWDLVAGAFSTDGGRNTRTGELLGLDQQRVYPSLEALIAHERTLPADERIEALAIVTPNHLHAPMAIAALDAGFHVFCEKPMAMSGVEAEAIAAAAKVSGRQFALAFTYSGYPMIEEARARVERGDFGAIRLVQVEYIQGWLSQPIDTDGNKQAEWRTDPARAGLGGCLGDIGTHAFQLAEHVSGLSMESVSADLTTHVEGPAEIVRTGGPGMLDATATLVRTPAGHPEGYIEAFANLYRAFASAIRGDGNDRWFPGVTDGLRTMRFIEAVIANAGADQKWTSVNPGENE
jgi:predicted dehydrogenase